MLACAPRSVEPYEAAELDLEEAGESPAQAMAENDEMAERVAELAELRGEMAEMAEMAELRAEMAELRGELEAVKAECNRQSALAQAKLDAHEEV